MSSLEDRVDAYVRVIADECLLRLRANPRYPEWIAAGVTEEQMLQATVPMAIKALEKAKKDGK